MVFGYLQPKDIERQQLYSFWKCGTQQEKYHGYHQHIAQVRAHKIVVNE